MVKKVKSTLFISEDKRKKIRDSGLTMEEYFNRLYETYERFSMDKWEEGSFWIGLFRVCMLRVETLNLILNQLEDEDLLKIGRSAGDMRNSIMKYNSNLEPVNEESRRKILESLNFFCGWGNHNMKKDTIIITMPIFTKPCFIQGYLESLLNLKLTLIESHPDRMAFKITHQTNA